MIINTIREGGKLTIMPEGRLDTMTSPELEKELESSLEGVSELIMDFSGVEYISSAGLRVLLNTHKDMTDQGGTMKLVRLSEIVSEVLDVTGFSEVLNVVREKR